MRLQPGVTMLQTVLRPLRYLRESFGLPPYAQAEAWWDSWYGRGGDPGIDAAITAAIRWLCHAQDCSASHDGGVARHYSLLDGWATSYPETTGYIVPTILDCANDLRSVSLRERARQMLDWLISIQLPNGGFQGGGDWAASYCSGDIQYGADSPGIGSRH